MTQLTQEQQHDQMRMPPRIYVPYGPAQLMSISPELQNNEGAWYVRESAEGDIEDLETSAPPEFKWPKPTLAGYDYALSMAELNGFDNVTHAIITAVALRHAATLMRDKCVAQVRWCKYSDRGEGLEDEDPHSDNNPDYIRAAIDEALEDAALALSSLTLDQVKPGEM